MVKDGHPRGGVQKAGGRRPMSKGTQTNEGAELRSNSGVLHFRSRHSDKNQLL